MHKVSQFIPPELVKEPPTSATSKQEGPTFKCAICHDTGHIVFDWRGRKLSRLCQCLEREIRESKYKALLDASALDVDDQTFESYRPQNDGQAAALEVMMKATKGGSFYLYGPWGTGKTHLLTASVIRAMRNGIPSLRITVPRLLDEIRRCGRENKPDIEVSAYEIPYLALDDLGKERLTDWAQERLYLMIDERYEGHRAKRSHTSFASNYALKHLSDRIDGAILDRIIGMCERVFVPGESYRRKGVNVVCQSD